MNSEKAVWKYEVGLKSHFVHEMPTGAKFLVGKMQREEPQMWFLVDPDAAKEQRQFIVVGTGHREVPPGAVYLFSFMVSDGTFVFHVFEVTKVPAEQIDANEQQRSGW